MLIDQIAKIKNVSNMNTLRIMSGFAVQGALEGAVLPAFQNAHGTAVSVEWQPTSLLMKAVAEGRGADIIIVTDVALGRLEQDGVVDSAGRLTLADSGLGLAVRKNTPKPDISTLDTFCAALTRACSVAYSKSGASGIYFAGLIEKLGIAEAVNARATIIPVGLTAEKLVTGEADLAVQQISELMMVEGIDVVGPFPDGVQSITTFGAAIFADCACRPAAKAFMRVLGSDAARNAYRLSGLIPR